MTSPANGEGTGQPTATNSSVRRRGGVILLGQPTLTMSHVVAQALAIGPIVSIALVGSLIAGTAGAAAPFVVLVTFVGALCAGWTMSLYARRYAGAGALYEYLALAHGKTLGAFNAGLMTFTLLVAGVPLLFVLLGLLIQAFSTDISGSIPGGGNRR